MSEYEGEFQVCIRAPGWNGDHCALDVKTTNGVRRILRYSRADGEARVAAILKFSGLTDVMAWLERYGG
jgi:hypothetical protein